MYLVYECGMVLRNVLMCLSFEYIKTSAYVASVYASVRSQSDFSSHCLNISTLSALPLEWINVKKSVGTFCL